jgi:osmotically-inducible protein OsmY
MKAAKTLPIVVAGLLLQAATAAADTGPRKDFQIFKDVSTTVTRYSQFTIFDSVDATVKGGVVTLTGRVTMPYKRGEIVTRVSKVDGVREVRDWIAVLPVSQSDDRLRIRIARAIYGNPNFWNYAIMADPPIHIVVERGHVRLTGVVRSDLDRMLARSLASEPFGVRSVTSELKTDAEVRDAIEIL